MTRMLLFRLFFITAMLYVYGRFLSKQLTTTMHSDQVLSPFFKHGLIKYHMIICYFMYIAGNSVLGMQNSCSSTSFCFFISSSRRICSNWLLLIRNWLEFFVLEMRCFMYFVLFFLVIMTGSCWIQFSSAQWCNELHVCLSNIWWTPSVGTIVSTSDHLQLHFTVHMNWIFHASSCSTKLMQYCHFLIAGFVWFILTLKKGMYQYQFGQYAWTHMILFVVFAQSSFTVANIFEGIIWYVSLYFLWLNLAPWFGSFCAWFISLHRQEIFILYSSLDSTCSTPLVSSFGRKLCLQ